MSCSIVKNSIIIHPCSLLGGKKGKLGETLFKWFSITFKCIAVLVLHTNWEEAPRGAMLHPRLWKWAS